MTDLPPIVGIGASESDKEALEEFISAVPEESGIAYVVVQQFASGAPSQTGHLIGAHTALPVDLIKDGDPIEPDHIYLVPPGSFLEIAQDHFRLGTDIPEGGAPAPIERFLISLSQAAGQRAFGVILSGAT